MMDVKRVALISPMWLNIENPYPPLGIAYIVSIISSLLVSLTLTPVLSYWLLADRPSKEERDGLVLRGLKKALYVNFMEQMKHKMLCTHQTVLRLLEKKLD